MYDDLLVPTDGSAGTDTTVDHALALAEPYGAAVHALYVVDRRLYLAADKEDQADVTETLEEEGSEAVAAVADRVSAAGLEAETAVLDGIPHREILAHADDIGADLIVMGTHGRTGRDRLANMGSVTDRVVQNAAVPVLVVRIDAGD